MAKSSNDKAGAAAVFLAVLGVRVTWRNSERIPQKRHVLVRHTFLQSPMQLH